MIPTYTGYRALSKRKFEEISLTAKRAHTLSNMQSKEPVPNITMHTKDAAGVWRPVIVDPMSDAALGNQAMQLLATQQAELQSMIRHGESVAG